jgi:predicted amino acid dehydrogenase
MAPAGGHQVPWFSFLAHLRSRSDLDLWSTTTMVRAAEGEDWRDRVLRGPPLVASSLSFRSNPVTGELIVIPRLPEDIIYGEGRRLIARSVEIAAARGSRVVGLGGLISSATRGGESLLDAAPDGLTITNGNSFTAAAARANVLEACEFLGRENPRVAVLGSTGSVGIPTVRLLADEGLDLLLIGRSLDKARRLGPEPSERIRYSDRLADIGEADVVLVLTSGSAARLEPELFAGGRQTVVIDVAQPPNVEVDRRQGFRDRQVRVVRGGWVQLRGGISSRDHERVMTDGDPDAVQGSAPACLGETYLLAAEGIRDHAVGPGSVDLARLLGRVAERRGVRICPLSFGSAENGGGVDAVDA